MDNIDNNFQMTYYCDLTFVTQSLRSLTLAPKAASFLA